MLHFLNVFDHRRWFYSASLQPLKTGSHSLGHAILKYSIFEGENVFLIMDGIIMAEILQKNSDFVYNRCMATNSYLKTGWAMS